MRVWSYCRMTVHRPDRPTPAYKIDFCWRMCLAFDSPVRRYSCLITAVSRQVLCCHCYAVRIIIYPARDISFRGYPDHRLDTGIVFRIRRYWEIRKVAERHSFILICQVASLVRRLLAVVFISLNSHASYLRETFYLCRGGYVFVVVCLFVCPSVCLSVC